MQVYGGIYRQKSLGQSHAARKLIEIHVHPHYEAASFDNDIAIAKVDRPFPSNSFTSTVCLPKEVRENDETLPRVGEKCFAIGWGKIRENVGVCHPPPNQPDLVEGVATYLILKLKSSQHAMNFFIRNARE